ncbi:MAG: PLP-dependent transferase, partial [bacterium]
CMGGAMVTNDEKIHDDYVAMLRTTGPTMSPFNAWVFLKGLETLSLRMARHCDNARGVADWLDNQDSIESVFYPGMETHPGHQIAKIQQRDFGGVVSFRIKGDRSTAWKFINATKMLSITGNLGDAKTTIIHPASTTHSRLTDQDRQLAGVTENLIRLAVGLEDLNDVLTDLERGLSGTGA